MIILTLIKFAKIKIDITLKFYRVLQSAINSSISNSSISISIKGERDIPIRDCTTGTTN